MSSSPMEGIGQAQESKSDEKRDKKLDGLTISLRAFKNPDLTPFTKDECPRFLKENQGKEWCIFRGVAKFDSEQTQKRNDKHNYYRVHGKCTPLSCIPCRTLIIVEKASDIYHFNHEYKTVQVAEKSPLVGGLTFVDFTSKATKAYDFSKLANPLWVQSKFGPLQFMVRLELNKAFNAFAQKDDVTGEGFPYVLSRFYIAEAAQ